MCRVGSCSNLWVVFTDTEKTDQSQAVKSNLRTQNLLNKAKITKFGNTLSLFCIDLFI